MSILSNYDIIDLCEYYNIPLVGVFSKNELPKKLKNGCYTINLADSDKPGSHWCGFTFYNGQVCYFDSFGFPPPNEIDKHMKKRVKVENQSIYSLDQIQEIDEVICGWFCVCFLYAMTFNLGPPRKRFQTYINHFVDVDFDKNKSILKKMINNMTSKVK